MRGGGLAGGQDGARVGQHRVMAVGEAGRAGVVGAAGELQAPAVVRPDRPGDADRRTQRRERAALLHVQFDERRQAGKALLVGADLGGVEARVRHRLGEGDALVVAERPRPFRVHDPGHQPAAKAWNTEPRALFLCEGDKHHRSFWIKILFF